ncbi:hypothetical protein LINGRAHAP2_LOCUS13791 [Linum grandiflorum]
MDYLPPSITNKKLSVIISAGKVKSGSTHSQFTLFGHVFWPLPKPLYALHHDLARQWKIRPREVHVYEAGHGLIQFVFNSEDVKDMVIKHQPWCYKHHIIHLIPWETPSQPVFDCLQFMALTVQLLEVPPHCLTTDFGKEIMAPVGEVLSSDIYSARPNGDGRLFLKVVVRMDLLASFPGKVEAVVPHEPSFDVLLGYEGLPALCFLYSQLSHIQRLCDHAAIIKSSSGLQGMWMLVKPTGFLLEDFDAPRTATPRHHPKSSKPPRRPLGAATSSSHSPLPVSPPPSVSLPGPFLGLGLNPEVPLINGMSSSSIISIELIDSIFPPSPSFRCNLSAKYGRYVFRLPDCPAFCHMDLVSLAIGVSSVIRLETLLFIVFPLFDDVKLSDLRFHSRLALLLASCDTELEDMLLVDRKRPRYKDDLMEDKPPNGFGVPLRLGCRLLPLMVRQE